MSERYSQMILSAIVYLNMQQWKVIALSLITSIACHGQGLGLLKYDGGGDWYANPSALENLAAFYQNVSGAKAYVHIDALETSQVLSSGISFLHVTGHGRIVFSEEQREALRQFTERGGFIHFDDNYGMKAFIQKELPLLFPTAQLQTVALSHPIFQVPFVFENGLPKIHEHDMQPSRGYGLIHEGRLICYYSYESDLGDGWEDEEVHNDSQNIRRLALKMGANILQYAFTN
jgi:hypothetical protein